MTMLEQGEDRRRFHAILIVKDLWMGTTTESEIGVFKDARSYAQGIVSTMDRLCLEERRGDRVAYMREWVIEKRPCEFGCDREVSLEGDE